MVGIDVSKQALEVCLMPDGETFAVANDQEGIDSLIERLEQMRPESWSSWRPPAATSVRRPLP